MHNQPFSQFDSDHAGERLPADPRRRLGLLTAVTLCGFLVIGVRVVYIQAGIAERYLLTWQETTHRDEPLPGRDGRILSRDGLVLAYDEARYDLAVSYRWLQSPPDPLWLRREVLQRLAPHERGDKSRRAEVEGEILQERERLWQNLSEVTEISVETLRERGAGIQRRIESMARAVERRRDARLQATEPQPVDWSRGWRGIADAVVVELTTPPVRASVDPIVLREELEDYVLVRDVPLAVAAAVQSQPSRFPGIRVRSSMSRVYPLDDFAPHLIGVRRPAGNDASDSGTRGESGIEWAYDRRLAGQSGRQRHTHDRRGRPLGSETVLPPRDGQDVVLTIDSRLQRTAEALLDAALAAESTESTPAGGCIVVMDLWTGDLLAAAAAPRHSLQQSLSPDPQRWNELLSDPRRPFFPRVSRMALPPGSVFKVITAVAALESGVVDANDLLQCRGYLDRPDRFRCLIYRRHGVGHGHVNLDEALCQSCNVYFYELARRTGPETLCDWARRFGFGQSTGSDLPGEQAGALPMPNDPSTNQRWYPGTTLHLAVGQGSLLATPLQVVRMMGAIGNGGFLVSPRVVLDQPDSSFRTAASEESLPPVNPASIQRIPGLSERTLEIVRRGLEMVVHHPQGTGRVARIESVMLAGKTGTAEVAGQEDHAWFAGYAPARSPRLAYVVVLEHGGSGGQSAGGIVRELMTALVELGYLRSERSNSPDSPNLTRSPD